MSAIATPVIGACVCVYECVPLLTRRTSRCQLGPLAPPGWQCVQLRECCHISSWVVNMVWVSAGWKMYLETSGVTIRSWLNQAIGLERHFGWLEVCTSGIRIFTLGLWHLQLHHRNGSAVRILMTFKLFSMKTASYGRIKCEAYWFKVVVLCCGYLLCRDMKVMFSPTVLC